MALIIDIGLIIVLAKIVIQTEAPLFPSIIMTISRLIWVPASVVSNFYNFAGLLIWLGIVFWVFYLYFWLLTRLSISSISWWVVLFSLPLFRLLVSLPWGLFRLASENRF